MAAKLNPDTKLSPAAPPWASMELSQSWSMGLTPQVSGPSTYFSWYELNRAMAEGGVQGIGPESEWMMPPKWARTAEDGGSLDAARASALGRIIGRLYLVRILAVKGPLNVRAIVELPGYFLARAEAGKGGPTGTQIEASWSAAMEAAEEGKGTNFPPAEVIADAGRSVFLGPANVTEEF